MKKGMIGTALVALVLMCGMSYAALIQPELTTALQSASPDQKLPVEFFMKAQSNALDLDASIADLPRPQRRARVAEVLQEFSAASQADLLNVLRAGETRGKVDDIMSLWLCNMVSCWATKDVIYDLSNRADVDLVLYTKVPVELGKIDFSAVPPAPVDGIEPNMVTTNVRGAWAQGYHGENVVLGVVDTGVWYTHDDLTNHLWQSSAYPNHGFNFASSQYSSGHPGPSTYDTLTPLDYYGHGTHCAGIATADGAYGNGTRDTMGIAPSTALMCVPVDVYLHSPYPDTSMENNTMAGYQFCVSPTRDPTNGADVITTSLGLVSSWLPRRAIWRAAEENILAAGIPHCIAAGNEGPTPRTIRTSADCPPPWPNPVNNPTDHARSAVITIGATDNSDNAASFTSIGPSDWGSISPYNDYAYPPGLIDPDVCMPGVDILSTYYNGNRAYTVMSGTSMATPGAAGVVCLMLSKNPRLTPRQIDSILEMHAVRDLGPTGKENTFGAGRLNCSLAVAFTPLPTGIRTMRYVIDDAPPYGVGNGDHVINPGETVNLPLWLMNLNGYLTQGVHAYLRKDTADPNFTLLDTFKTFGNMAIGDSAYTGVQGYKFSVVGGLPNGYQLRMTLVCEDTMDSTWSNPLGLTVGTAVLTTAGRVVHDPPPGGNGNGGLDPNETADLEIGISNIGGGNATGVTAILRSMDARFSVIDSFGTYGAVPHDTTVFNTADQFQVHADASIPREFVIPCSLYIAATGYSVTVPFSIPCGILMATDPIPDGPRTPALYYAYDDVDSFYVQHPTYNWIETRGRGTQITLSDDQTVAVPLPGGFGSLVYYGTPYTGISVCSNGWVAPGSATSTVWGNAEMPTTTLANAALAVCWDDIYPPEGGGVWYYHDTANHAFVIEWDSVAYYSPRTDVDKYQIVLWDSTLRAPDGNNTFSYQYMTANAYTSNTVGMQNQNQTIGINALYNGAYHRASAPIVPGRAIRFTTEAPVTAVAEPPLAAQLGRFALSAANPFRTDARVQFSLPKAATARLKVYDLNGRQVRLLLDGGSEPLKAGRYSLTWDGRDDAGRRTAGGVYFYRLETSLGTLSAKTVRLD